MTSGRLRGELSGSGRHPSEGPVLRTAIAMEDFTPRERAFRSHMVGPPLPPRGVWHRTWAGFGVRPATAP